MKTIKTHIWPNRNLTPPSTVFTIEIDGQTEVRFTIPHLVEKAKIEPFLYTLGRAIADNVIELDLDLPTKERRKK